MLTRRSALLAPLAAPVAAQLAQMALPKAAEAAGGKMMLSIHQNTSRAAGYRKSLEGWAKAGIKYVELTDAMLDDFLKTDSLASAKKVVDDLGLKPVSSAAVLPDMWVPGPAHAATLETWKKRCEQFATIGLDKIYCPSTTNRRITADDYKATPGCIREGGDIAKQFNLSAMIEFARTSTHIATLSTALKMIREANHTNVRPMLDFFHFWSGLSKFEDLDMLKPGELLHVHFQDTADDTKEMYDNNSRLIPGDGVAPVVKILRKLAEKGYAGACSVELFRAELVNGDPYEVGKQIKEKCDKVMRLAKVI
jgi:2-keto-myo-inositol isomerase